MTRKSFLRASHYTISSSLNFSSLHPPQEDARSELMLVINIFFTSQNILYFFHSNLFLNLNLINFSLSSSRDHQSKQNIFVSLFNAPKSFILLLSGCRVAMKKNHNIFSICYKLFFITNSFISRKSFSCIYKDKQSGHGLCAS